MDKQGYVKLYWSDVKNIVKKTNFEFFSLVEQLNPNHQFPLFLLTFPYGKLLGDEISQFIPINEKEFKRLSDPSLPSDLQHYLSYGKNNSPLGLIVSKQFEWYVDLPQQFITLPIVLKKPGDFFSYTKILNIHQNINYSPMGVLSAISGVRSVFMLPSIHCQTKLLKLNRELRLNVRQLSDMYDHFDFFQKISCKVGADDSWCASLIYFSEPWVEHIKNHPDWFQVKRYFYELFLKGAIYQKNTMYYQMAYSLILKKTNQKPNPYLFDTFKHLVDLMVGEMPGFQPLVDNEQLPLNLLQEVFLKSYGISHIPTIMGPGYFSLFDHTSPPLYYSLQFPTTPIFSPNSKKTSMMVAMRDLKDLSQRLLDELVRDNHFCSDTVIQYVAKNVNLSFFHNAFDVDKMIASIEDLVSYDPRFLFSFYPSACEPAQDSKFFRGCIRVAHLPNPCLIT